MRTRPLAGDFTREVAPVSYHRGGRVLEVRERMSASDTRAHEGIARADRIEESLSAQIYESFIVGVDDEGFSHHYYAPADEVVVYDGRALDDRVQLDGEPVRAYVEFVTQFRAWRRMGQFYELAMHYERAQR